MSSAEEVPDEQGDARAHTEPERHQLQHVASLERLEARIADATEQRKGPEQEDENRKREGADLPADPR